MPPDDAHDEWLRRNMGIDPARMPAAPGQRLAGLDSEESLLAAIAVAFRELDAARKQLVSAGISAKPLQIQIADLHADLAAAKAETEPMRRHVKFENLRLAALKAAADGDADLDAQTRSTTKGGMTAIEDLWSAAAKQIDTLPHGKSRDPLDHRLTAVDGMIQTAKAERDPKRRAAAATSAEHEARALLAEAARRTGNKQAVQAAYAEALKDKYGFEITNKLGTRNTHLDDVYTVFEMVPVGHVAQSKLQELAYDHVKDGDGQYDKAKITMTDFGAHPGTADYTDPTGTTTAPMPPNAFDISALHELGHSVNERWGIMAKHGAKPGCGGWQSHSLEDVANAVTAAFLTSDAGFFFRPSQDVAKAAITAALDKGTDRRPAHVSPEDWKALDAVLKQCIDMRDGTFPWERPKDFGGRSFHEAGKGAWVSCMSEKRADPSLTVRDYQWRSPDEFFAELYAFTWLQRVDPPGGIENAIKPYLFQKTA